jgi:hypothetical protein
MVELDGELTSRCQIFKERLVIPARDAQFHCLPAEPKRLEGLDYTLPSSMRLAWPTGTATRC